MNNSGIVTNENTSVDHDILNKYSKGKHALVAQGGGQKGIFTTGVLDSFLAASVDPFDVFYGTEAGAQDIMTEREPFMRDVFNGYLRGLSESDVRGMAGILQVKSELLKRARAAVGNDLPQEILIRDLIVQ